MPPATSTSTRPVQPPNGLPSRGRKLMPEESTTPDLIDSVRRGVEAFNRRDLDAMVSIYAPDVVWDGTGRGIGRFDGVAAFRAFLEDWLAPDEEGELYAEEVFDHRNIVALAILHQKAPLIRNEGYLQQRDRWGFPWGHSLVVQGHA